MCTSYDTFWLSFAGIEFIFSRENLVLCLESFCLHVASAKCPVGFELKSVATNEQTSDDLVGFSAPF